mmetsp:Transcript_63665/g.194710  ORF Transcript_63665/g.194710 Transcript_63665/m.194710 type:complete len:354 (+) Transcript_63665:410-1471(+)
MDLLECELHAPFRVDAPSLKRVRVRHAGDGQVRPQLLDPLHLHVIIWLLDDSRQGLAHLAAGVLKHLELRGLVAGVHVRDADLQHRHPCAGHRAGEGDLQQVVPHEKDRLVLNDVEVVLDALPGLPLALLQALGLHAQGLADGLDPGPRAVGADGEGRGDELALFPPHERGRRPGQERVDPDDVHLLADFRQVLVAVRGHPSRDTDALALELELQLRRHAVRQRPEDHQGGVGRGRRAGQRGGQLRALGGHRRQHGILALRERVIEAVGPRDDDRDVQLLFELRSDALHVHLDDLGSASADPHDHGRIAVLLDLGAQTAQLLDVVQLCRNVALLELRHGITRFGEDHHAHRVL